MALTNEIIEKMRAPANLSASPNEHEAALMEYRIEYYEADGLSSPPEDIARMHPLHGRITKTLRQARSLVRNAGCRYGQWTPPHAVTAYHESRRYGCGGYTIFEVN